MCLSVRQREGGREGGERGVERREGGEGEREDRGKGGGGVFIHCMIDIQTSPPDCGISTGIYTS